MTREESVLNSNAGYEEAQQGHYSSLNSKFSSTNKDVAVLCIYKVSVSIFQLISKFGAGKGERRIIFD